MVQIRLRHIKSISSLRYCIGLKVLSWPGRGTDVPWTPGGIIHMLTSSTIDQTLIPKSTSSLMLSSEGLASILVTGMSSLIFCII